MHVVLSVDSIDEVARSVTVVDEPEMIDSLHLTQLCPHEAVEHADLKLSNRLPLQVLGVFSALQRLCLAVLGKARHKTAILQDMQDLQMRRLRSLMRCRADLEQAESDVLHVSCMLAKEALVHDTQLQSRFLRLVKSDKFLELTDQREELRQLQERSTAIQKQAMTARQQLQELPSEERLYMPLFKLAAGPLHRAASGLISATVATVADDDMKERTECDLKSASESLVVSKADFESETASFKFKFAAAQSACTELRSALLLICCEKESHPVEMTAVQHPGGTPLRTEHPVSSDPRDELDTPRVTLLRDQVPPCQQLGTLLQTAISEVDRSIINCESHFKPRGLPRPQAAQRHTLPDLAQFMFQSFP